MYPDCELCQICEGGEAALYYGMQGRWICTTCAIDMGVLPICSACDKAFIQGFRDICQRCLDDVNLEYVVK